MQVTGALLLAYSVIIFLRKMTVSISNLRMIECVSLSIFVKVVHVHSLVSAESTGVCNKAQRGNLYIIQMYILCVVCISLHQF